MNKRMKYFVTMMLLLFGTTLCTACSNEQEQEKSSFKKLKEEVYAELEAARDGKYENLNITCDKVRLPQNEAIQSVRFPVYEFTKKMSLQEKLDFYKNVIFPKIYDQETVDESCVVDLHSRNDTEDKRHYEHDYTYLMEHINEIDASDVLIGYFNSKKYQFLETIPEGVCMNMSFGTLGTMFQSASPFVVDYENWEGVKTYDCYVDDLSDSYLLMDGEKTVAEAKAEMEQWMDTHYPLVGEDNGIRNEIYEISVMKIPDTEYHVFHAARTLSYNGIPARPHMKYGLPSEIGVMGEAYMCESDKVDTFMGMVNCYDQGSVTKEYEELVSFEDVLSGVSYYLTGDTTFNIEYIGLEYRIFIEKIDGVTHDHWVPYWCFHAKNPNDDKTIEIYINMETGEIE